MNSQNITIAIMATLSASIALADDFKTLGGTSQASTADTSGLTKPAQPDLVWAVTDYSIGVFGKLTVKNTGKAKVTIGNIVVNLQKPNSPEMGSNASYVSVAADVADATHGDAATAASIVAAGSQENQWTNVSWATNNYTVNGAKGTFVETRASGSLRLIDDDSNTVWAISPEQTIAPNASINLHYQANFDNTVLKITATSSLSVEVLVSLGNAGALGGSGATATNIDINGNTTIDSDEANVRTVPSRIRHGQGNGGP